MSKIIKEHVRSLLEQDVREDSRKLDEYRTPITIEYGISSKSADGSARVKIGDTEVVAGVKLDVGAPYPDAQDQGNLIVGCELLPLSNPEFEPGPPNIEAIEIARVVDRGIRESQAIDLKKLCIKKGEKVWTVFIDIYPINDGGNLFDATSLAAMAALEDTRFPEYDTKEEKVLYEKRTSKKLPLACTPISVTVLRIGKHLLIDPTDSEWKSADARLTVTSCEDGEICSLQKGEEKPLSTDIIEKMIDLAIVKAKELRKHIKK